MEPLELRSLLVELGVILGIVVTAITAISALIKAKTESVKGVSDSASTNVSSIERLSKLAAVTAEETRKEVLELKAEIKMLRLENDRIREASKKIALALEKTINGRSAGSDQEILEILRMVIEILEGQHDGKLG